MKYRFHRFGGIAAGSYRYRGLGKDKTKGRTTPTRKGLYAFPRKQNDPFYWVWKYNPEKWKEDAAREHIKFTFTGKLWTHIHEMREIKIRHHDILATFGSRWVLMEVGVFYHYLIVAENISRRHTGRSQLGGDISEVFIDRKNLKHIH